MRKQFLIFPLLLSFLFLTGCNDDDDDSSAAQVTSQIVFKPKMGTDDFSMSDVITYSNGTTMRYEQFKYYISNVILVGSNGEETYVDSVHLIDLDDPGSGMFDIELESGAYEKIKFGIGLSPNFNSSDPTLYEIDHPLSTLQNMYWSWATMYRFISISGYYSTTSTSDLTETFAWHPGRDQLYKEVEFNLYQKHFYDDTVLEFNLDIPGIINKIETVDVPNEPTWHGSVADIAVAQKIVDNFAASLSIKN